jgi:hypothetical protein
VLVEFLCETGAVDPGRIFKPKGKYAGSKFGAFNVRGAQLVPLDFIECEIEGERLDDGGRSRVAVRVANLLPYAVLKVLAFQDRHENKDAYDLVFTLLHHGAGPRGAGAVASASPIVEHPQVREALGLMGERFSDSAQDGACSYAAFLATPGREEESARLRMQAVIAVEEFLEGLRG